MIDKDKIERDFGRDIWCIFGMPFDNCSIEDTCGLIDKAIKYNQQCILSTPSLHFIAVSRRNPEFKRSIMESDASTIDSAPIFWISRLLGYPIKEKVYGATLMEYLLTQRKDKNYRLFFFGGEEGAARMAFTAVNDRESGIRAAGYYFPGYGSVEEMSQDYVIAGINETDPDILLVALGAEKGVPWIARNKDKIKAKVICHFGAVINFIAGKIKRAPLRMQKLGLEWIWRIMQEPVLCKRYLRDGVIFLHILITRVAPHLIFLMFYRRFSQVADEPDIELKEDTRVKIHIKGVCNYLNNKAARNYFREAALIDKDVILDLSETEFVDNSFLGLLLILLKYKIMQKRKITIAMASGRLKRIFKFNLLENTFSIT